MKTSLPLALSTLWRSPKIHFLTLLLLFCAWPEASTAQAQTPITVGAWGYNEFGLTDVPVAAQSGVTAIAAGAYHTAVLKNDGTVVAWGDNGGGQVTGTPSPWPDSSAIASPVTLGGQVLSGVTAIAAGFNHTVALKTDGSVLAWGYNDHGQANVPVAAQSGVTAIAAGDDHTVALKNDGSVVAWGDNDYGQTTVPVAVQSGVTAIAAGGLHTVALKNDGSVVAWGNNDYGQTAVPVAAQSGVTAIAAGEYHTAALKNDGSVVAWGNNGSGPTNVPVAAQSGVTAVAAGGFHTVALKNDGTVVAWGQNGYAETNVPAGLSGVTAIAVGWLHTVVLVALIAPTITTPPVSQAVNVWQSVRFNVAATGFPVSYQWRKDGVDLAGATRATYRLTYAQTTQAGSYTVVVSNPAGSVTSAPPAVLTVTSTAFGTVVAWGDNGSGQTNVPLAAQSGVTAIATGKAARFDIGCFGHIVALKNDGSVVAWGANYYFNYGQTTIPAAAQSGVTAIAAGAAHTVALKNDGSVVAWGDNYGGQTNVPVAAQSGVTAIAAGDDHTVVLKDDGAVVVWGSAIDPCTGIAYAVTMVPVAAQSGVTAIAAGGKHTVALKNDGSVLAWGYNCCGQMDVPVAAQSGVTAIAAGGLHTVALKNDGSVVAWGDNYSGQTNVPVAAQSGVTAIAAGGNHTVALKNDGSVVAWGYNDHGQVTGTPTANYPNSETASPVTLGGLVLSGVTAIAAGCAHTVALIGTAPLLPSLNVRPSGHELILSWSTNVLGFTLQSTLNLTPPVTWIDSTNPPAVIGTQFTVTNTPSGPAQFYRLRKP